MREREAEIARRKKNALERNQVKQKFIDSDVNELPEVDQQQSSVIAAAATNNSTNKSNLHSPKSGKLKVK